MRPVLVAGFVGQRGTGWLIRNRVPPIADVANSCMTNQHVSAWTLGGSR